MTETTKQLIQDGVEEAQKLHYFGCEKAARIMSDLGAQLLISARKENMMQDEINKLSQIVAKQKHVILFLKKLAERRETDDSRGTD